MARCPSLPDELWELVISFIIEPLDLLSFFQVNVTTRCILANPNHKAWSNMHSKARRIFGLHDYDTYRTWLILKPARKYIRIHAIKKCMLCNETGNVRLYALFQRKLCTCCFHENTINASAVKKFFPEAENIGQGMRLNQFPALPAEETGGRTNIGVKHYWKADFLSLNAKHMESAFVKGEEQTFEEYEQAKQLAIDDNREKRIFADKDHSITQEELKEREDAVLLKKAEAERARERRLAGDRAREVGRRRII